VIGNLLNNAIKYTPPGGHIGVRWRQEDDTLVLSVSDDGIGIAPETLAHVFELFVQDDRTIDRAQGGLGIGLALVRSLVELHGGSVQATSAGVGRGSCFTLRLPVAPVDHAPLPAACGEAAAARRVLVVDDNADAADTLALVLSLQGHDVQVATSARAAIATAAQFRPEVVFLDIGLPEMDGYAVARALRAQEATRSAVLVALTGYGTENDRQRARDEGFDAHLTKPADIARINQLLAHLPSLAGPD
jgi:CheY-like chemotaxis protein